MRKIITITYITLDGVMQAPGGPEEDTENGFAYGGWQFGEGWDEISNKELTKYMTEPFELLLGRKTYDIWAPFWPTQNDDLIAKPFNSTKKYVVSHNSLGLSWNNSTLLTGDVVEEIRKLKDLDGPDLVVWGSGNLIQTLLKHNLIDRMHIWIYPITLGTGKKLFAEGTQAERFKVVDSKINTAGVVIATYEPLEPLKTGSKQI
jgi:dihydrofolate reductase